MEGLDLNSPIVGVVVGIVAGAALIALSHRAKGLPEPVAGIVRLQAGEVSFTEIFGTFVLGYGIGTLVNGPTSAAGGPPGPPGVVVGRFGGGFNPFARGGIPVGTGFAFAFLMFLYRIDIVGKLSNPQTHKSVTAITARRPSRSRTSRPAGTDRSRFRDPGGTLVGVMARADVHVPRGTRVRIVGTRGLNPLVVPETPQG